MSKYDTLNPMQREAVFHTEGPLLVLAGAGSGKTRVLTHRIAYLIEEKRVAPWNIMAITFTNKAAAEMRERIAAAIGAAVAQDPSSVRLRRQLFLVHRAKITTVHALCMSLAREQAAALGIAPDFRLMDENESKILRAEVLEEVL